MRSKVSLVVLSASSRVNLQPTAELEAVNVHIRDTVVLRNVILALSTSLVTAWQEEGERGECREGRGGRERAEEGGQRREREGRAEKGERGEGSGGRVRAVEGE